MPASISPSLLAVHPSPYNILASSPSTTLNMAVTNNDTTVSVANKGYGRAREWLQQRIHKVVSRKTLKHTKEDTHIQHKASLKRPSTALAFGIASTLDGASLKLTASIDTKQSSSRPLILLPPIRPLRPESSVIRDVTTWLEASTITPSPPLMSGVSYWREAAVLGLQDSAVAQHAVPLSVASRTSRPSKATKKQTRHFQRSAIKAQVRMPSLLRTKPQHPKALGRNRTNRQSTSLPPFAISYESVREGVAPVLMKQAQPSLTPLIPPSSRHASMRGGGSLVDHLPHEHSPTQSNKSTGTRFGSTESDSQRRTNKLSMYTARGANDTRPSTAAVGLFREGSMGGMSDAPTYSSGPPPPSYRSRPESTLTTSSFGCVDGMNPAQRQNSQQRAALQRGMRCRLKRLAQSFAI